MTTKIAGANKVFFGTRKDWNEAIYLSKPTWDCEWYWSFGYLGNKTYYYHLSEYSDGKNVNMYDALLNDYDLTQSIKDNLWLFCELALTAYALKQTAETLGRGGSHMTTNPLSELIVNKEEVYRINNIVLPAIFNEISNLIEIN